MTALVETLQKRWSGLGAGDSGPRDFSAEGHGLCTGSRGPGVFGHMHLCGNLGTLSPIMS